MKGHLQTEFADITSYDANLFTKPERGHLSVDYTCMKWLSLDRKVHIYIHIFLIYVKLWLIIAFANVQPGLSNLTLCLNM